jgi:hypothetical protein
VTASPMTERVVKYLYKYRSLGSDEQRNRARTTIVDSKLYFAQPREFNDPFDCFPVPKRMTEAQVKKVITDVWRKHKPQQSRRDRRAELKGAKERIGNFEDRVRAMVDEVVNSVGVLSLSEKPDDVLMWSHYSTSHTGICLRFKVLAEKPFFVQALPVRYQAERPVLDLINDDAHAQSTKALLTKADYWSYEKEWRIIEHDKGPGVHIFPPALLDGIILGAATSKDDRALVRKWIVERRLPTELLQARFHEQLYALRLEPEK